jgi:exodeoxyribonuclease VII large subunit
VDDADFRLRRLDPRLRLSAAQRRQELASSALHDQVRLKVLRARAGLDALAAQLAGLSPLSVLDRGYAIVQNEAGRIAKNAADTPAGSQIDVRLAKGRLVARVTRATPAGSSELPS